MTDCNNVWSNCQARRTPRKPPPSSAAPNLSTQNSRQCKCSDHRRPRRFCTSSNPSASTTGAGGGCPAAAAAAMGTAAGAASPMSVSMSLSSPSSLPLLMSPSPAPPCREAQKEQTRVRCRRSCVPGRSGHVWQAQQGLSPVSVSCPGCWLCGSPLRVCLPLCRWRPLLPAAAAAAGARRRCGSRPGRVLRGRLRPAGGYRLLPPVGSPPAVHLSAPFPGRLRSALQGCAEKGSRHGCGSNARCAESQLPASFCSGTGTTAACWCMGLGRLHVETAATGR